MQTTPFVLMVRPAAFAFNEETAGSNAFQDQNSRNQYVQDQALAEFDGFVSLLTASGVEVTVVDDTPEPHTPDSIFPNNWISTHSDGTVVLYPMEAPNRRLERRPEVLDVLRRRFEVKRVADLSRYEQEEKYLEGTGSMVLDRDNKIAYACLSTRTHPEVLKEFEAQTGYHALAFHAHDRKGTPIYHTNVMMCIASAYVVVCLEAVKDEKERKRLVQSLQETRKDIIEITLDQAEQFAGNMLELSNPAGDSLLVLSEQAWHSLTAHQRETLNSYSKVIYAPLHVIERCGGGSARCMVAEIHLPQK